MLLRKKIVFSLILFPCLCIPGWLFAQRPAYQKIENGIIVYPDTLLPRNIKSIRIKVVSDNILRITASPTDKPYEKSLITVGYYDAAAKWSVTENKERLILKTRSLTVHIQMPSGTISFYDRNGNAIAGEQPYGRNLEPVLYDGKPLQRISQTFHSSPDDAYYGLGQHQDGIMNYKGEQEILFQNNTEVGIPFLVSNKHYGILWDNYSITRVGDTRSYQPLSALKLFSKDGQEGWLTATYSNDKNSSDRTIERPESAVNYEYLNDLERFAPQNFKPANGKVLWEGSIASGEEGMHHFRFTYAGYIKVWLNGQLMLDRWREAWNPCTALIDFPMEKNRKYSFKVEWIPDGGASYISIKYLNPVAPAERDNFTFSSDAGEQEDYYFIYGRNMDDVISGYRKLTGKAVIVPKWALGLWQSRERYKTEKEVLETVAEFRKRKIPLDNIVQDWSYWKQEEWGSQEFDPARFPSPDSMIEVLHNKFHTHFMISVWPKFYEGIPAYNEFNKNGWLYKRNVADSQRDWIAQGYISTFYDVFNKDARKGFWDLLNKKLFSKGVDAWWMDASEPDILSNSSPEKRIEQMTPTALGPAAEYLNAYPLENAIGIYEGQRSVKPDQRVVILTRSAFAGSQHYGAAVWSGDIAARWHDMKNQIAAGINFSLSGIPYWTMDIGGFAVQHKFENAKGEDLEEWREQMTRWYQFGAFTPLFRVHGQYPYREIYNVAPEEHSAYKTMLYYDKLRYRLLPYLYSLAGSTYHNDYTIMRGLVMDFSNDTAVLRIADQFLLGPSLLINPVYNYKERSRPVYLPKSKGWYDLYSGTWFQGGQKINAPAPYERIPVFVKAGSILPFGPELQYTSEKPADTLTLYVYAGDNGSFTLYEDEGINYNYEKGFYTMIPIRYNDATKALTIGKRQGSFSGMLQHRLFNIVLVTKEKPRPLDFSATPDTSIKYTGSEVEVKLK